MKSGRKNTVATDDLEYAGIQKRFQAVTFSAIDSRGLPPVNKGNYAAVKKYAENLEEHVKSGYGLIMLGRYGTMKTTMAVAILREWLNKGHCGLIVPMCSVIDNLCTMRILNREEFAKYERRLRTTPLLILDDLGGEDTDQKWVLAKIDSIITERYNKMLATIVTSNLTAEELASTYSERIIDRLKNTSRLLVFNADSQRRHFWEE